MSAVESRCPSCSSPITPGQQTCPRCGRQLGPMPEFATSSPRDDAPWTAALNSLHEIDAADRRARRRRIDAGLLLMMAAFALLWIPYASDLGALLAFIGVILFVLGRNAFDERFRRSVVRGAALVLLGLTVSFFAGVIYASAVSSAALAPGETVSDFLSTAQAAVETLIIGSLVAAIFVSVGYVFLPYGKADPATRRWLWTAAIAGVTLSAITAAILWSQILGALSSATSGGTLSVGPIAALQTESILIGLIQIVPNLIYLYAYHRIRSQLVSPQPQPSAPAPLPHPPVTF